MVEVTNIPVPYRIPIHELVAADPRVAMTVLYCAAAEPGRKTDLPPLRYPHVMLQENYSAGAVGAVHNNRDVLAALRRIDPDVVITDGFQPTMLYAFGYAKRRGAAHVSWAEGTLRSERVLTWKHRLVRRVVFRLSHAFLATSEGSRELLAAYHVPRKAVFKYPLAVDNARFAPRSRQPKRFDLLFCSRLAAVKQPLEAIEVAERAAEKLGRELSLLMVGSGEMEAQVRARAVQAQRVRVTVRGFAPQAELPDLYRAARVFLLPTQWDPWAVVVNEACAAGLPVIVTPEAGSAGEIVLDGENGFVRDYDRELWSNVIARLLSDAELYGRFAVRSLEIVSGYTYGIAAEGWIRAALYAHARTTGAPKQPRS